MTNNEPKNTKPNDMDNSPLETDDTLSLPIGNVEGRIITRGSKLYHYRKASRGIAY